MVVRLIGAGFPRTGTTSICAALESLTGQPCYHMHKVFARPEHAAMWSRALDGDLDVLDDILDGYACAVDWPMSSLWREAADRYPDAMVLLSHRGDADTWWNSVDKTVWAVMRGPRTVAPDDWWHMTERLQRRFAEQWDDEATAKATYEAHLVDVRMSIPPDRLVEYQPGDGWAPLCRALGVEIPDEPFPHLNTRDEFVSRLDSSGS